MAKKNRQIKKNHKQKTKTFFNKTTIISATTTLLILIIAGTIFLGGKKMTEEIVVLETNHGNIEIEFYKEQAPITVANFLNYVDKGFYDGTIFHRVIDGFMIQGGGFLPDGSQKKTDSSIKLETHPSLKNEVGTLAMARTNEPNSATSQFFINVNNNQFLNAAPGNPGYAVFGRVVNGMDVVNKIKVVETTKKSFYDDWPVEDVIIVKAYRKK